jgi:hypothetical protein
MEGKTMSVERPQGLSEGSGQRGEPRRLDQMVSARLDPELVATLREFASRHGMSLSDVLREAAVQLLAREASANIITFDVTVINGTRPGATSRESYRQEIPTAI